MLFKIQKKNDFNNYIHRSFVQVFLLNICRVGFQFLIGIILVHGLGVSSYGFYAYFMAILNTIVLLSSMGISKLSIREVARLVGHKQWGALKDYISYFHKINITIIAVFVLLLVMCFKLIFSHKFSHHMIHAVVFGIISLPFLSLGLLRAGILRGLKHPVLAKIPELVATPFMFVSLLGVTFLFLNKNYFNITTVFIFQLASIVFGFVLGLMFLLKELPHEVFTSSREGIRINVILKQVLPFLCLVGVNMVNTRIDILLLGFLRPTADVGIYRIVMLFVQTLGLPLLMYNAIAAPLIANAFYEKEKIKLQRVVIWGTRITFVLTFLGVLFLSTFGYWILNFFYGALFSQKGYTPLIVLSISQLINVGFGAVALILNMTGHERWTLRATTITIILNVILNVLLVPIFGIMGSAIATAISLILWNIILFVCVYHELGINSCIIYEARIFFKRIIQ